MIKFKFGRESCDGNVNLEMKKLKGISMACLSTCNIGFLLKDVSYLFETSELRNSNIY